MEEDKEKLEELTNSFILFIESYDNYRLNIPNLIHSVISMYCYIKTYDFDNADKKNDEVIKIIYDNELYATVDLFDPIKEMKEIRSKLDDQFSEET
jgi:hypothetical protein